MMRVKIVLVSVSNNCENEDGDTIVEDKKIDFRFSVSGSELNLSETILEPSRAQVMLLNFVNEDSCVSVFFYQRRLMIMIYDEQVSSVEDARSHAETQTALRGIRFVAIIGR